MAYNDEFRELIAEARDAVDSRVARGNLTPGLPQIPA